MVHLGDARPILPRRSVSRAGLQHVEGRRAGTCGGSRANLDGGSSGAGAQAHSTDLLSGRCRELVGRCLRHPLVSSNRVAREQILAPLCMLTANDFLDCPRRARVGHNHPSGSLRSDGGGSLLSDHSLTSDRNALSSLTDQSARQRSALEKLVATVAPERATRISNQLIKEFGSLGRVLAETGDAQARVLGHDIPVLELLKAAREAMEVSLQTEVFGTRVNASDPKLIRYLVLTMGSLGEETLRVLYLDHGCRLLAEEQVASGGVNKLTLYPRAIFKRALEKNSSQLILVHNHPAGSCAPSAEDLSVTSALAALGRSLEVTIFDHIIVAGTRWTSMRAGGHL
jgi:DNA repair protein RadC